MATTSPDNLRTPNPTDPYNLVADLAILASDTQAALGKRGNRYIGTKTQMDAFTSAPEGTTWFNTTDKGEYLRVSGVWYPRVQRGVRANTSATNDGFTSYTITFDTPFPETPSVVTYPVPVNNRLLASVRSVTPTGFTLLSGARGGSYSNIDVAWIARM